MTIGTIYATNKQLDAMDKRSDNAMRVIQAKADKEFSLLDRRTANNEVRYYKSDRVFVIATRYGTYKWFEARVDGDYPVKA